MIISSPNAEQLFIPFTQTVPLPRPFRPGTVPLTPGDDDDDDGDREDGDVDVEDGDVEVEDGDVEYSSTFPRDSSAWLDVCLQADLELSQGR